MKIITIILLFMVLAADGMSQDSLEWKYVSSFSIGNSGVWATDIQGNLYGSSDGKLLKWDLNGTQQFAQSLKQTGTISSISPVNTMKVLVFSEEQQSICFLDNTLSFAEECIDLDRFGVAYATQVTSSGQADRFWVLDQVNNTLSLINWNTRERIVDLLNVSGMISAGKPIKLIERSTYLFYGEENGIFQFDRFGSLVNAFKEKNLVDFEVTDQFVIILTTTELIFIDRQKGYKWIQPIPVEKVDGIFFAGKSIYFRQNNTVEKYTYFIQE